jgi:hypothetical protein
MAGKLHNEIEALLMKQDSAIKNRKFRKSVAAALLANDPDCDVAELGLGFKRIPDAYKILPEEKTVVCYEIEITNPINKIRLADYAELWFHLDAECWKFRLHPVSRYAQIAAAIDLPRLFLSITGVEEKDMDWVAHHLTMELPVKEGLALAREGETL